MYRGLLKTATLILSGAALPCLLFICPHPVKTMNLYPVAVSAFENAFPCSTLPVFQHIIRDIADGPGDDHGIDRLCPFEIYSQRWQISPAQIVLTLYL